MGVIVQLLQGRMFPNILQHATFFIDTERNLWSIGNVGNHTNTHGLYVKEETVNDVVQASGGFDLVGCVDIDHNLWVKTDRSGFTIQEQLLNQVQSVAGGMTS